jgi:hypothetical protein
MEIQEEKEDWGKWKGKERKVMSEERNKLNMEEAEAENT